MKSMLRFCVVMVVILLSVISADPLQHGKYFKLGISDDIHKYFVSEKLDGFRGYWNGKELRSKSGYAYQPPEWFTEKLGTQPLDGELWLGRDRFEELAGILNGTTNPEGWHEIDYMVFDMPAENLPFSERFAYMQTYIPSLNAPHVKVVSQVKVNHIDELYSRLDRVVKMKGEGLMLHHEDAMYGKGRVNHLLKLKPYEEGKGRVIGYKPGKGKYTNQVGSLIVELEDGVIIHVGSGLTDQLRREPPAIDSVIAFAYNGLTKYGKPRFARFKRVRLPDFE